MHYFPSQDFISLVFSKILSKQIELGTVRGDLVKQKKRVYIVYQVPYLPASKTQTARMWSNVFVDRSAADGVEDCKTLQAH